jgi:hypothetical protein
VVWLQGKIVGKQLYPASPKQEGDEGMKQVLEGWIVSDGTVSFEESIKDGFCFYVKAPYYTAANSTHVQKVRIAIEKLTTPPVMGGKDSA